MTPQDSHLVLVPNRALQQQVLVQCLADTSPGDVVAAPPVQVLSLWAGELLRDSLLLLGRPAPMSPRPLQEQRLWEAAIRASDRQDWHPGDVSLLAREAMAADRLCEHWLMPRGLVPGEDWDDGAFIAWRRAVRREMGRRHWLGSNAQLRWLAGLARDDGLPVRLPGTLELRGFLEVTPLERQLLDAFESLGTQVRVIDPDSPAQPEIRLRTCPDPESEVRAAAVWARAQLREGRQRVAIAVNDLEARRHELERVLAQVFHPEHALAMERPGEGDYHLQGGRPLMELPLIREALALLSLSLSGPRRPHPFAVTSRWLRSSAWRGADDEAAGRARLELWLRRQPRSEWSLAAIAHEGERFEVPVLRETVSRLGGVDPGERPARRFLAWLAHWGWPGALARGVDAQEAIDGMKQALELIDFSDLRDDDEALEALKDACRRERTQGVGGDFSPVQVLALEDAAGLSFDAAWVLNVHADNWPAPARPNRLLPFRFGRHLPRTRPEQQLAHAERVREGVLASAARIVFSRPRQVDGVPTSPSTLLPMGLADDGDGPSPAMLARRCWPGAGEAETATQRDRPERFMPRVAPALPDGAHRLHGAIGILNLQAACPWAAFLVHRLDARIPDSPTPFADAAFTGSLVHRALERLYAGCEGQRPGHGDVPEAVEKALEREHADLILAPAALEAERRRLVALLGEWLDAERAEPLGRPLQFETRREGSLGGFHFEVRMDRVDHVGHGVLLLDYKTGVTVRPAWAQQRPTECQLPLYAVLGAENDAPVAGIGLLGVRAGDMWRQLWVAENTPAGKGIKVMGDRGPFPSWAHALERWREVLEGLLSEYRSGACDFIVHHAKPLEYQGLDLLLRLDARQEEEEER